jgi:hypothetical protein
MDLNDKERRNLELIADAAQMTLDEVADVYIVERTQLQQVARIPTYVPLIAEKHARDIIKHRQH